MDQHLINATAVCVAMHEAGHAVVAKAYDVEIKEIDIRSNPDKLPGITVNGYQLRCLPLQKLVTYYMAGFAAELHFIENIKTQNKDKPIFKNLDHFTNNLNQSSAFDMKDATNAIKLNLGDLNIIERCKMDAYKLIYDHQESFVNLYIELFNTKYLKKEEIDIFFNISNSSN